MPNFKRIGGGPWKPSVDLTWNDPARQWLNDVKECTGLRSYDMRRKTEDSAAWRKLSVVLPNGLNTALVNILNLIRHY